MQYSLWRNGKRNLGVSRAIRETMPSRRRALARMTVQIAFDGFLPLGTGVMSALYLCLLCVISNGNDASMTSGRKRSALFTKPLPRIRRLRMFSKDVRSSVSNSVWAIDFILRWMASTPPRYEKCQPAGLKILSGLRNRTRVADGPWLTTAMQHSV